MKTIDVEGLPEPVAQTLQAMVEALRRQIGGKDLPKKKAELPRWPGKVIGSMDREDLYAGVG